VNFKQTIDQDLKAALLGGDKEKTSVLRGLKSAVLYEEVAKGARDSGLPEDQILSILQKEAKKRQESADLYVRGGNQGKADAELSELKIIEEYLPAQLSEDDIVKLVDVVIAENGAVSKETMGATIAAVKQKSGGAADGATVARLVRERIVIQEERR
jgi:uncharacterized protein YqeY